jgi:glycosyltransferase involved in cell wall biosynthesis
VPAVLLDYARAQVAAGHVVHAAVASPVVEAASAAGAVAHVWDATRSPGRATREETRRLAAIIAAVDPDLAHLHSAKAGLAGRLALRGRRPTVFQPHAWSFEAVGGPVRVGATAWERYAVRWTHRLLCVSEAEAAAGAAAGIRGKALVVPNGIDLARHRPGDRAAARSRLGLEEDRPVAVCLGRVAEQKGQDLVLEAMPAVRAACPEARVVMGGDGPCRAEWEGRGVAGVDWVGAVSWPGEWFAAADVVVVPSRWEAMALVPLEAMAAARSVVAFDVAGVAESVPDGAGAVVPAGDVPGLAAALVERLRDRPGTDAEGLVGRDHVERHHDATRAAARVLADYAEVIARGGG